METLERFSATQAAKLAGLPYHIVRQWDDGNFIKPSLSPATGTGSKRGYAYADVLALRVAAELRRTGVSLQSLRKVVEHLRARGVKDPPLASAYLISDGRDVFECRGDELASVLRKPGQAVFHFVVDIGRTERELREQVAKLQAA